MRGQAWRTALVLEEAPTRIPVRADPDRLRTMVGSLVENALRRSVEGGEVRCSVSTSGRQAHVAVTDQGATIPAEDLAALFTRFGTSSFAGGQVAAGGLGLYLARELARLHGGDVEVRTPEGGGGTFVVVLPLAESRWARLRRGSGPSE
jgi:two-component system OmpR family sensor kinase